mmetsp:Transcript_61437/g.158506  ORF Transcript_61437/g.158506 Transcript_61437/m.158506 type:complete len:260 (+) Transcript_61437:155-934(+)
MTLVRDRDGSAKPSSRSKPSRAAMASRPAPVALPKNTASAAVSVVVAADVAEDEPNSPGELASARKSRTPEPKVPVAGWADAWPCAAATAAAASARSCCRRRCTRGVPVPNQALTLSLVSLNSGVGSRTGCGTWKPVPSPLMRGSMPKSSSRLSARPPSQENSSKLTPCMTQWPCFLFWASRALLHTRSTRSRSSFTLGSSMEEAPKVLSTARSTSPRVSSPLFEMFQYVNQASLSDRSGSGPSDRHRLCSRSCRQAQA